MRDLQVNNQLLLKEEHPSCPSLMAPLYPPHPPNMGGKREACEVAAAPLVSH